MRLLLFPSVCNAVLALLLVVVLVLPPAGAGRAGMWDIVTGIPGAIAATSGLTGYTLLVSEAQHLILQGRSSYENLMLYYKAEGYIIHVRPWRMPVAWGCGSGALDLARRAGLMGLVYRKQPVATQPELARLAGTSLDTT